MDMTYFLELCLLTISFSTTLECILQPVHQGTMGLYLNVWCILFGWRMCEGPWTSAVLNCSASSQCTRWNFTQILLVCSFLFPLQQPQAWMHAHARDGVKPWLSRFTDVPSKAGAALALKMLLLRFIVLTLNFVLTIARLYLKRKEKEKKKQKRKKWKKYTKA